MNQESVPCTCFCSNLPSDKIQSSNLPSVTIPSCNLPSDAILSSNLPSVEIPRSDLPSGANLRSNPSVDQNLSLEDKFRLILKKNQYINHSFESMGSPSGFQTYGVMGTRLKRKIIDIWRKEFCNQHMDNYFTIHEIDTPIIGPEHMYQISGHVDQFTDPVIKDTMGKIERVDHYLKNRINQSPIPDDKKHELIENLGNYSKDELQKLIEIYGEDRKFSSIYEQMMMLETKTSYSDAISYLRPETAQGLISEFKNIYNFYGSLPFGISQHGRVYRKEINPKPFIRLREFEQAEIELFYDPMNKTNVHKHLISTEKDTINLHIYSAKDQENGLSGYKKILLGNDYMNEINEIIVYFMYKTWIFMQQLGINPQRLRFRQHLKNELAHYSNDCWDLEYLIRNTSTELLEVSDSEKNWLEIVGIADRGSYDLTQHNNIISQFVKRYYEPPVKRTVYDFKFNMKLFGKKFLNNANTYKQMILNLETKNPQELDRLINNNNKNLPTEFEIMGIDNINKFILEPSMLKIVKSEKMIDHEDFIPSIIEPSFGIDRIMYACLNSSYWMRPEDSNRCVLSLNEYISPVTFVILPLFNKEIITKYIPLVVQQIMRHRSDYNFKIDSTSASIGKRYTRYDEIGVPFAITIDYQTNEDMTVTIRNRDTMIQTRSSINNLFD